MSLLNNKIILGTAQFGNKYGVTNNRNLNRKKSNLILTHAISKQINTLDVSPDYKNFEIFDKSKLQKIKIISKFDPEERVKNIEKNHLFNKIEKDLKLLNSNYLEGLLFRKPVLLINNRNLWDQALFLKEKGIIEKIGYTVYSPDELDIVIKNFKPDIVQLPFNILDRRFENMGWLDKLYNMSIEVHVRSVFLQGLLLVNYQNIPRKFSNFSQEFLRFDLWIKSMNISRLDACLNFVNNDNRISKIIVGVVSLKQLKEILSCKKVIVRYPKNLMSKNEKLINPKYW